MLPPAPARFSTTTVWPNFACICVARMRARRSAEPPAPNGTTMVICFAGQAGAGGRREANESRKQCRKYSTHPNLRNRLPGHRIMEGVDGRDKPGHDVVGL